MSERALIVFLGGGLGAGIRALILAWLASWNALLPFPVLLINLVGTFILALVFVLADELAVLRPEARLFLAVGVLGGFTTFSTFGWGADLLLNHTGGWAAAVAYILASVLGGALAVRAGLAVGRALAPALGKASSSRPQGVEMASIEAEDRPPNP